ncbi:YbhB/YbcL family Raf kinase inhibitor-like protein [Gilvimarinus algae]|uniref:YbhB/YbcL family Raf kinase inhibitor-like protein n=1 Tax=Gilvimarinus algae TaxID=3058037 RepID=A0ABT8TJ00_9GAMM|nr:YbhB/YbcL family Raf kinase inhibitor-like protein [Gilvimarinus sp. SDUM040014]MDO3384030.1 YbhB/YbcL family Raf kinase inhibitor-like protein [Gilvimarinus sp. SDUM040014]
MKRRLSYGLSALVLALCAKVQADTFTLHSDDISDGEMMSKTFEFEGFGCNGDNLSPQLSWSGAPEGTEAYAVFAYDPDAPTGSGWWHWQLVNLPASTTELARGAGSTDGSGLPEGAMHVSNDYRIKGFGGACPPQGHGVHRYQFTVYALPKALDIPENASGALAGYMVNANALASSTIEALYKRD